MGTDELPSADDLGTEMVTFEIGASKKRHTVHKQLLIKESPYFRARFEGQWKGLCTTHPIPLLNVYEAVFKDFVTWLYFRERRYLFQNPPYESWPYCFDRCVGRPQEQTAENIPSIEELTERQDEEAEEILASVLAENCTTSLYIFADQFDIPSLREFLVNTRWLDYHEDTDMPRPTTIVLTLRHLPPSSPYRRLITDLCLQNWNPAKPTSSRSTCPFLRIVQLKAPAGFWYALAKVAAMPKAKLCMGALCEYHEHAQDEEIITQCAERMAEEALETRDWHPDWQELEKERRKRKRKRTNGEYSE